MGHGHDDGHAKIDPTQRQPGEMGDEGGITWKTYVYKEEWPKYWNEFPRHDPKRFKDMTGKCLPPGIRIPRPDKWDHLLTTVPQLISVQERLKSKGLKDPWLRHYAWQYDSDIFGTRRNQSFHLFRAAKYGIAALIVTLAIEKVFFPEEPHDHHPGSQFKLLRDLDINRHLVTQTIEHH